MLSQQTEIEILTSDLNQTPINSSNMIAPQNTLSKHQKLGQNSPIDNNCSTHALDNQTPNQNQSNTQIKLRKLQQLYQQGLGKLQTLNYQNQEQYQQKSQAKSLLQMQLSRLLQPSKDSNQKTRKGSQASTAGEDEEVRMKIQEQQGRAEQSINTRIQVQIQLKQSAANNQLLQSLQQKLNQIRIENQESNSKEQTQIQQLKAALQQVQTYPKNAQTTYQNQQPRIQSQTHQLNQLQQKILNLQQQKTSLSQQQSTLQQQILQFKRSIIHFSNSTQYLRSTQTCCQEILNEQLCSIQYKLQGKRLQYDSNKRYLDKVIRTRKYEDNVSFDDIQHQINYLNDVCEQMIDRKSNFLAPQIKKYKHKRLQIIEQINQFKSSITLLSNKKKLLQLQTKEQNKIFDQLQDEYFALLEKVDDKTISKLHYISPEEKLDLLKDKKHQLTSELKEIVSKLENLRSQIDQDQSLVPPYIVKQLKKKIQKKKQELRQLQLLNKQNTQLQKQNKLFNEEKNKIEWKSKPQIDHLSREQKQLKNARIILQESVKSLKENNDSLQDRLRKMQEEDKRRRQQVSTKSNEQKADIIQRQKEDQERQQKQEQQRRLMNRSKLIEKFRQKTQDSIKDEQEDKTQQKQNPSKQSKQPMDSKRNGNKGKKGGKGYDANSRRGFFVARENPLENLRSDFPLNGSQETSKNLSLLQSNPALYMFLIYFTVVLPGLGLGYCL